MAFTRRLAAVLLWLSGSVVGLHDVIVSVPEAVALGTTARLRCRWTLHPGESLYTVKWYHGAQEFFRFVPKEMPNTRVFSHTGISVDLSRSGAQEVAVRVTSRALTGRYRCEVSADAPSFHTTYRTKFMQVVEIPTEAPKVSSAKSWLSSGDILRANCSVVPADPPANLSWLVNGVEVKGVDATLQTEASPKSPYASSDTALHDAKRIIFSPWEDGSSYEEPVTVIDIPGNFRKVLEIQVKKENSKRRKREKSAVEQNKDIFIKEKERSNKTASFSRLVMRTQSTHFHKGVMNVTCVAQVLSAWSASASLLVNEESPQIAPVKRSSLQSGAGEHINVSNTCTHIITMSFLLYIYYWSAR